MQEDKTAPVWEHISELRRTLIHVFLCILVGFCLCFLFYQQIFNFLTHPLQKTSTSGSGLLVLGPLEGISIAFKVCFWLGVVLSSPAWGFTLLRFIVPALRKEERSLLFPFIILSYLFILIGFASAYFMTIPLANTYLQTFNASLGVNLWTLSNYLDYTFFLLLANGIAFEMGLLLLFLVHIRILTAELMIAKRRHMIVLAFILGAFLTPPEILTQLMLALPLIILYELAILYAKYRRVVLMGHSDMN